MGWGVLVPGALKSNREKTFLTLHQGTALLTRVGNQETVAWLFPEWLDLYHQDTGKKHFFCKSVEQTKL